MRIASGEATLLGLTFVVMAVLAVLGVIPGSAVESIAYLVVGAIVGIPLGRSTAATGAGATVAGMPPPPAPAEGVSSRDPATTPSAPPAAVRPRGVVAP